MKRTHNLKVANGSYEVDGQEKTRWLTIGGLLQGGSKMSIKLDTIPVGDFDGWVQCFPVEERPALDSPMAPPGPQEEFSDDVPF